MSPEEQIAESRALVKIIREYYRLQAEVRPLTAMLETSAKRNEPLPPDWKEMLEEARKTPGYRSISEQDSQLLSHLEADADAHEQARSARLDIQA